MTQADLIKHITVDLHRGVGLLVNGVEADGPFTCGGEEGGLVTFTGATFTLPEGKVEIDAIQGTWTPEEVPNEGNPVEVTCADDSEIELTTTRVEWLPEAGEKQVPWGEGERTIDETHLYFTAEA